MANNMQNLNSTSSNPVAPTQAGLDELNDLLQELKGRAQDKVTKQDAFMLNVYIRLIAQISPMVQSVQARLDREDLAAHRRNHKSLRQSLIEQNGSSGEA